jgi:hypothetical protein
MCTSMHVRLSSIEELHARVVSDPRVRPLHCNGTAKSGLCYELPGRHAAFRHPLLPSLTKSAGRRVALSQNAATQLNLMGLHQANRARTRCRPSIPGLRWAGGLAPSFRRSASLGSIAPADDGYRQSRHFPPVLCEPSHPHDAPDELPSHVPGTQLDLESPWSCGDDACVRLHTVAHNAHKIKISAVCTAGFPQRWRACTAGFPKRWSLSNQF